MAPGREARGDQAQDGPSSQPLLFPLPGMDLAPSFQTSTLNSARHHLGKPSLTARSQPHALTLGQSAHKTMLLPFSQSVTARLYPSLCVPGHFLHYTEDGDVSAVLTVESRGPGTERGVQARCSVTE